MRNVVTRLMAAICLSVPAITIAADEPVTRPKDIAPKHPPTVTYTPQVADMTRPAYVPSFAKVNNVPALKAERDHALMHQLPSPVVWPYVWYPGCTIFGYGGGYGYVANHGFYR